MAVVPAPPLSVPGPGGEIVAVDRMAMPADTGLAAIERHPDG
jgi:hypothetical protein